MGCAVVLGPCPEENAFLGRAFWTNADDRDRTVVGLCSAQPKERGLTTVTVLWGYRQASPPNLRLLRGKIVHSEAGNSERAATAASAE